MLVCTSRSTKCCTCKLQCPQYSAPATKFPRQGPQSTVPATTPAHQDLHRAALPKRFATNTFQGTIKMLKRSSRSRPPPISTCPKSMKHADSQCLSRNQLTPKTTTMSKVLHLVLANSAVQVMQSLHGNGPIIFFRMRRLSSSCCALSPVICLCEWILISEV